MKGVGLNIQFDCVEGTVARILRYILHIRYSGIDIKSISRWEVREMEAFVCSHSGGY